MGRCRRRGCDWSSAVAADVQHLERRDLLTVSFLEPQSEHHAGTDLHTVTLKWQDSDFETATAYHVWLDQQLNGVTVISRIFFDHHVAVSGLQSSVWIPFRLQAGEYKVWVRRVASMGNGNWSSGFSFQLDDDGDPETPLNRGALPSQPVIRVVREGQGIWAQAGSEPAIGWSSQSALHNVQLYRHQQGEGWQIYADACNLAARSITQRQLAVVAASGKPVFPGDLPGAATNAGLPEGQYRLWVQAVNGAVDNLNRWAGSSAWSVPLDFEVRTLTGQEAIPAHLTLRGGIRPSISWDAIPGAEHHLLSIQRGPDYSNHPRVNVRVYGTQFEPSDQTITGSGGSVTLEAGAEYFIRVRGVDQHGTDATFRFGNFAYATLVIPAEQAATAVLPPVVHGPVGTTFDPFPVISWNHQPNAEAYEVWLSDFTLNQRVLLAGNIRQNFLHLDLNTLQQDSQNRISGLQRWSGETGLADGRYRFWVRSVNSQVTGQTAWSGNHDFTIESSRHQLFSTSVEVPVSQTPLVGGSHILSLSDSPDSVLIGTSGQNFGRSVLARYRLSEDDSGELVRPTEVDAQTGQERLVYEDLQLGRSISDIKQLPGGWVVVICRDSGDLYLIDPDQWVVVSRYDLRNAAESTAAEPMNIEVLASGRVLLSLRNSDSLRLFQIDSAGNLSEQQLDWQTGSVGRIEVQRARADSVSAYLQDDGNYAVFASMSDLSATAVLLYQPESGAISWHPQSTVQYIQRNKSSTPFSADAFVELTAIDGEMVPYFLAADRNGFLTWVNVTSFDYGFVDLVQFLPGSSRIAGADSYINPADNGVDSAEILSVGQGQVLIANIRRNSLLLQITTDAQGQPLVISIENRISSGGDAFFSSSPEDLHIYVLQGSTVSRETFVPGDAGLRYLGAEEQLLATPNIGARVDSADRIIIQQFSARLIFMQQSTDGQSVRLHRYHQPFSFGDKIYRAKGPAAPVSLVVDGVSIVVVLAAIVTDDPSPGMVADIETFLLVLDATDVANVFVRHVIDTGLIVRQAWSLTADQQTLILMDRLGGRVVRVRDWSTQDYDVQVAELAWQVPNGFGASRNAKLLMMDAHTEVIFHDTSPDIGFTVIHRGAAGEIETTTFHAQNTTRSLWTIQQLDADRIVGVTFDGRLLVFNVRNGIFEANLQLPGSDRSGLSLEGADFVSFTGRRLVVGSKSHGRVAVFDVLSDVSATSMIHRVMLKHVINTPALVAAELFGNVLFITEALQIRRVQL